jgi:hypothetical protein
MDVCASAIMGALLPGQERHYVCPVYIHKGIFYCLTEIRETDSQTGQDAYYRLYEAFDNDELDWLNEHSRPCEGAHALVSWNYWQDPVAADLVDAFRATMPPRDPFDAIDTAELRADLDKTLAAILGR